MKFCFRCRGRKHPTKIYENWSKSYILIKAPKLQETKSTEKKVGASVKKQRSEV